jgi:hypothetical protein
MQSSDRLMMNFTMGVLFSRLSDLKEVGCKSAWPATISLFWQ